MTSKDDATSQGTTSRDYGSCYYDEEGLGGYDNYRWDNPHWRTYMSMVADRLVALADPKKVLDVGCARGLWVRALRERGVEAFGVDISEAAIASADPEVRPFLEVRVATEPFDDRYDLITCSEVLEHLSPADAQLAIDNICAATDRVLFSSSPGDFDEPTHVNTKPTATWAAWFAERGFYRRTDVDVTFHSPWSIYFERQNLSAHEIVQRYEDQFATLNGELVVKRESLLLAHRRISTLHEDQQAAQGVKGPTDDEILARHAELVAVDNVIGLEATVIRLQNDLRAARTRTAKLRNEIKVLRGSTTWKIGRIVTRWKK